jgi:hypothetical protein
LAKAIASLVERVHLLASNHIHQLLESFGVIGERHQQFLVASAVDKNVLDMSIDGAYQPGLLFGHMRRFPRRACMISARAGRREDPIELPLRQKSPYEE